MSQKSYIKCLQCGVVNEDCDYCTNCGTIINVVLSRKLEHEKKLQLQKEKTKEDKPSKIDEFLSKASKHPNGIIRLFSQVIYSVWLFLAVVVGGLIAAVVTIAAG